MTQTVTNYENVISKALSYKLYVNYTYDFSFYNYINFTNKFNFEVICRANS